ncbi:MAG: tol-pal system protein YbgF [Neorhizobium sp.]|nr:tol-pal system protein YbgF [Neorhizobium sp.]
MKKLVLAAMLGLLVTTGQAGAFSLPKLFGGGGSQSPAQAQAQQAPRQEAPVILAQQSNDLVQMQQLQDQLRQLTGRVEDMSYQILQMQEQMRKTQQDNEFRFQDLEKGGGAAPSSAPAQSPAQAPRNKKSELDDTAGRPAVASNNGASGSDDVSRTIEQSSTADLGRGGNMGGSMSGTDLPPPGASQASRSAPPPATLGSMEMDQNGNPIGASRNDNLRNGSTPLPSSLPGVDGGQQTASLGTSEGDAYKIAYDHVLSGDYRDAERDFTSYISSYPKSPRSADANFWLGEAQYSQGKYNEAAKTFLNAHQTYGKTSPKAPEMLLKLGMSLAALDNTDTACVTLREVPKRYPTAARAVLSKVSSEQKRLGC